MESRMEMSDEEDLANTKVLIVPRQAGTEGEQGACPEENHINNGAITETGRDDEVEPKFLPQFLAAAVADLALLGMGASMSFSAIALPQMQQPHSDLHLSDTEQTWFASLLTLGYAFGAPFGGYVSQRLGPKLGIILPCVPCVLAWGVVAFASDVDTLYAGRFVGGLAGGATAPGLCAYVAETAHSRFRGTLVAMCMAVTNFGMLTVYVAGAALRWDVVAIICGVFPFLCGVFLLYMPESPLFLLAQGQPEKARKSLRSLRGSQFQVGPELREMQKSLEESRRSRRTWTELWSILTSRAVIKPFLILNVLQIVQNFCGVQPITFYTVQIFRDAQISMNEFLAAVIVGVFRVAGNVLGSVLILKYGRKPLFAVACSLAAVAMATMGVAFYLTETETYTREDVGDMTLIVLNWTPLIAAIMFISAYSLGISPIPWVLLGELYPNEVRSFAVGLTVAMGCVVIFLSVILHSVFVNVFSLYGAFWLYATVDLAGTIFFIVVVPETKDKTFTEIQAYFKK